MNRSLYTKLVLIILFLIISLTAVTGVFLTRGVRSFYLNEFYNRMQEVFSDEELASGLRSAAQADAPDNMAEVLGAYTGRLGIDTGTRNYHILSGETGAWLAGSVTPENGVAITPNIISAIAGENGYASDPTAEYMDVALPIEGGAANYIVYVVDNRATMQSLNSQLLQIIVEAMGVGLIISVFLSLLLAKTMIAPIQDLTRAAEKVAHGDYDVSLPVPANGEIRTLAIALNAMSEELKAKLAKITREKNERDAILSSMTEGVILVKGNGIIKRWNRAAETMFRFSGSPDAELSFAAVTGSRELIRLTEEAKNSDTICEAELSLNMPDGERSFIARAGRLNLGEKRRPGVLLVLTDITVIRKLEEFRRDFIADVSHEIKTPLTSIVAAVETLESAQGDPEAQTRFLKIITQQATRLNALVQDILSLSNLEHKRLSPDSEMADFAVEGVLREALELCRPRAEEKKIRLNLEISENMTVCGDARLLEQAVVNLIDNAVKYSSENSEVDITLRRTDDGLVRIDVADHGIGIAKEHQERVFERFYRVDKARSRKLGGTGLGLAIVKHVALFHGGRAGVVSEPGKGSDFYIQFPQKRAGNA